MKLRQTDAGAIQKRREEKQVGEGKKAFFAGSKLFIGGKKKTVTRGEAPRPFGNPLDRGKVPAGDSYGNGVSEVQSGGLERRGREDSNGREGPDRKK